MADEPVVVPDPSPAAADPVADPAAVAAPVADSNAAVAVAPVIPESYDFKALKLPDGIALDDQLVAAVAPVFKKLGMTQEAANELVEVHSKALAEISKAAEVKAEADFVADMANRMKQYQATLKTEFGTAYDSNIVTAQRGMARFCSPAMKQILDETGLGSHPEFVKAFLAAGKMVSEDNLPNGMQPAGARKPIGDVLYGTPVN